METWTPVFHKGSRKFSRRLTMALGQRICCVGCALSPGCRTLPASRGSLGSGQSCPSFLGGWSQCLNEPWELVAFLGHFRSHIISMRPRSLLAEVGRRKGRNDVLALYSLLVCNLGLRQMALRGKGKLVCTTSTHLLWFICQWTEDRVPPGHQECHVQCDVHSLGCGSIVS
jgi:hypothetical protein